LNFNQFTNRVQQQLLCLLNPGGYLVPDEEFDVRQAGAFPAVVPQHRDGSDTEAVCRLQPGNSWKARTESASETPQSPAECLIAT
jgi:hypothetical protein